MPEWYGFKDEKLIDHYTRSVIGMIRVGIDDIEMMRKEILRRMQEVK
jgi:hypothetical protein